MQLIKATYEPVEMALKLGMTGKQADQSTTLYASILIQEEIPLFGELSSLVTETA